MKLEDLSKQIKQTPGFPPVHLWNPDLCEGVKFNIDRNGEWFYQNSPLKKESLKILFASILKKENNNYYCVTPVEKVLVEVDLAPYMIIDFRIDNDTYLFDTNLNYSFALKDTQISFLESNEEIIAIIDVRDSIERFFSRNIITSLGIGGSNKYGEIILQGRIQEKVINFLNKKGYKTKKVGG